MGDDREEVVNLVCADVVRDVVEEWAIDSIHRGEVAWDITRGERQEAGSLGLPFADRK